MLVCPQLWTKTVGPFVKRTVRSVIARHWRPEIVTSITFHWFVRLLRFIICSRQVMIEQSRRNLVALHGHHRGQAYLDFSSSITRGIEDCFGGDFRLIDWRHWLGLSRQAALHPTELRRVKRGHLHHRDPHLALVMQQFAAKRFRESLNGMFGAAISRLQRNSAISESRTDLNDVPMITRQHPLESCQRAVNDAQVSNFRDAVKFFGSHLLHR